MVRRPGKIIEIGNPDDKYFVKLYETMLRDRIDVIVMSAVGNVVEYGFMQVDDKDAVADSEDVKVILRALLEGDVRKRSDIVYHDELENWLLYYFRNEDVLFAASDDSVYALGGLEGAANAAAEVDERLRDIVASFVSLIPV